MYIGKASNLKQYLLAPLVMLTTELYGKNVDQYIMNIYSEDTNKWTINADSHLSAIVNQFVINGEISVITPFRHKSVCFITSPLI